MQIRVVSEMTPRELAQAVNGFRKKYVSHWEDWLNTPASDRVRKFGTILRKWRATRPHKMRNTRDEAEHEAPFLDDLIGHAQPHLGVLEDITLTSIHDILPPQRNAMHELWNIFRQLTISGSASCVGISKAVLLLTDGRIGPAFDSNVRDRLSIDHIENPTDWITVLVQIGLDVRGFERKWGIPLSDTVPPQLRRLEVGRLYDMVLGHEKVGLSSRTAFRDSWLM